MLVLSRKAEETIRIGDQITIKVLRVKGKSVKLGIEAPADVAVMRGELEDWSAIDCSEYLPSEMECVSAYAI